ncbi:MAG: hypothetical protein ACRDJE_00385 [Dehalococcoidia bacterium]
MTAITMEQREYLQAAAERVAAKLKSFYESLPDGEQLVLDAGLSWLLDGKEGADVSGHAPKKGIVTAIAKAIVWYVSNATPVWSDDFEFPYTSPDLSTPPGRWNGPHYQ